MANPAPPPRSVASRVEGARWVCCQAMHPYCQAFHPTPLGETEALVWWPCRLGVALDEEGWQSMTESFDFNSLGRVERLQYSIENRFKLKIKYYGFRLSGRALNFQIEEWYSRLGNNIQQILIAILHAEFFRGRVEIPDAQLALKELDKYFMAIVYDFSDGRPITGCHRSKFFYFHGFPFFPGRKARLHNVPGFMRLESLLPANYIVANIHRVSRDYLRPLLVRSELAAIPPQESPLVLHLRAGDVAALQYLCYATNPLCYYRFLRRFHDVAVIVVEPGPAHPLINDIRELFAECQVVSGAVDSDFAVLRGAKYLANSGVGTFSIAAALLSGNIKRFYCSSAYLEEHLNPSMLNPEYLEIVEFTMPGFLEAWYEAQPAERLDLLHSYQP